MNSPRSKQILSLLKYGKRAWNFEDVEECCRLEGIEIVYAQMKRPGFYWHCDGIPTIVISLSLQGIKRLFVALHELGHYYSDTPDSAFYTPNSKNKREYRADRFALIALIPLKLMRKMLSENTLWDLQEEYGIGSDLLSRRWELYRRIRK